MLEEALSRFLAGDAAAFGEIVVETSPRLVRVSARIMGSIAEAEDVVQESYVKAHGALLRGEFDRTAKLETWLYRIVVNGTLDAKRKKKRAPIPTDELTETGASGSAEAVVALRELSSWMADLPEDQRAVLVMKAMEGLETKEIAEIMGCSEGSVEQRLVRARQTLRERRNG